MAQAAIDQSQAHAGARYTTFSPRLAPALCVAGGLLAIAGGLGAWVQVARVTTLGSVETSSVSGTGSGWGWIVAGLGAIVLAFASLRGARAQLLATGASIAAVVLLAIRVAHVSALASRMAFRAAANAGRSFTAYHAGFGWGAWAMTLAAVLLSLGVVVSVLRWIDERQGFAR